MNQRILRYHKIRQTVKKNRKPMTKEQQTEVFNLTIDVEVLETIIEQAKKAKEARFKVESSIIKEDQIRYDIFNAIMKESDKQLREIIEVWGK